MPVPTCPVCGKEIGWKHSATFWNPWNYPCPHCRAALEASKIQKYIAMAVIPVGLLIAIVPISLEELGVWGTAHSLLYFAVVVAVLSIGAWASWSCTHFSARQGK